VSRTLGREAEGDVVRAAAMRVAEPPGAGPAPPVIERAPLLIRPVPVRPQSLSAATRVPASSELCVVPRGPPMAESAMRAPASEDGPTIPPMAVGRELLAVFMNAYRRRSEDDLRCFAVACGYARPQVNTVCTLRAVFAFMYENPRADVITIFVALHTRATHVRSARTWRRRVYVVEMQLRDARLLH
jgi:hypothetical protein